MIEEDGDAIALNANKGKRNLRTLLNPNQCCPNRAPFPIGQSREQFIRLLPTLSLEYYNPKAANLKAEFSQQIAALATTPPDFT
jgi:hypothetical protein